MPLDPPRATDSQASGSKRIACVYLPHLLAELTSGSHLHPVPQQRGQQAPRGIVLADSNLDEVRPTDRLDAVCFRAHRVGVRAGQTINEARALISDFQVEVLEIEEVEMRLIAIAETITRYGTTVSWNLRDTVWLDTTGVSHLFDGEEELAQEIREQVRLLGHVARICIASGPTVARAIARYKEGSCSVIPAEETARAMGELPIVALPVSEQKSQYLCRLGLLFVEQVRQLPPKAASARLGERALEVLSLARGIDPTPLTPGEFPRFLCEEMDWEDPAYGLEPLLFALRGSISRLAARLCGRGEACCRIELCLEHDQSIARHRGVLSRTLLEFDLSTPLHHEGDLERVLKSRVSQLELKAPTVGLKLRAEQLTPMKMDQMSLSETGLSGMLRQAESLFRVGQQRKQELAVLLAELEADVGQDGIGTLQVRPHFRPEARSVLEPVSSGKVKKRSTRAKSKSQQSSSPPRVANAHKKRAAQETAVYLDNPSFQRMTRLSRQPRPIHTPLEVGASFGMGNEFYTIASLRFIERLEGVEWWTSRSTARDYFWAWLKSPRGGAEALLFVDRNSHESYLQAWGD